MMRFRILASPLLIFLGLLVAGPFAYAGDFNYTNLEMGYTRLRDAGGESFDGGYLAGMVALPDAWKSISLAGVHSSYQVPGGTLSTTLAGLNAHFGVTDESDFISDLFYERDRSTSAGLTETETGYAADAGFRVRLSPKLDFDLLAGHQALSSTSANFTQIAALYELHEHWALNVGWFRDSESLNQYTIGIRYEFSRMGQSEE
jgi:hypothetical protein